MKRWIATFVLAATSLSSPPARAGDECTPFTSDTFPPGMVWWRPDPEKARAAVQGSPEANAAYLVTGVRPDGVLVQNREARYPRLLGWKVLARSRISTDGRRSWQAGCLR